MILAKFKQNEYNTTACGLVQWDYGQILKIEGVDAGENPEVHFSVRHEDAVIVIGTVADGAIEANIPNEIIEKGEQITAYIYVANESSGKTIRSISIPVKRRPRPDDYDSPANQNILRKVLGELKGKADGIEISDGYIQLLSGTKKIGERVRLPAEMSGNIEDAVKEYLEKNPIQIKTTNNVEQDNTLPVTSAGVYAVCGNIEALLQAL